MSQTEPSSTTVPALPPDGSGLHTLDLGKGRHTFKWLDYEAPSPEALNELQTQYDFHPLAMEDVRTFDERAKVLDFGNYLFITVHALRRASDAQRAAAPNDPDLDIHDQELEVFLGKDYVITVHAEPLPEIERAAKRFVGDPKHQELGPDYLLYLIVDEMTDALFPMLDQIDDQVDSVEEETMDKATPQTLRSIFQYKHDLIKMRRSVAPMRDVMNSLASTRYGMVDAKTALYFRDVYDRLSRIYELIETARDLLGNALDTYLSVQSNRLNEVVKRLTVIATIFLPISFIVGWGGMNFRFMPFDSYWLFWVVNISLIAVPIGMVIYFRRKGWA
jgi:magnesium transporter